MPKNLGVVSNAKDIPTKEYIDSVSKLYIGATAPVVTQPSMWLETLAGVPKSLWLVTP